MPRRPLVARPRLTERLRVAPHSLPRLVLVAAPAGFGKTTVLTQWLTSDSAAPAEASPRVAWLSLDRGDTDPRRFLAHLLAALRSTSPDLGADALDLMGLEGAPPTDAVLVSLVNDLDTVDGRTVIALDDYHVIDSPAVHEAVTYLIDNLPPRVTIAITTRADPPLPLSRLRASGELLELRASDLRFTRDEADTFLNQVMGLELEPRHVAALEGPHGGLGGRAPAGRSLGTRSHRDG